jgi:DNA-binding transcriptional MocR family regulator
MATPLLAEVATRWIADGTAARLVGLQRERLALRHSMVHEHLGEYVIGSHHCGLSAWLGFPDHWQLDSLVQQLRHHHIAVTAPDPFLVLGTPRPNAIRVCVGAEVSDVRVNTALATIADVFCQYPQVHHDL